jgi:hypothetical protein
MTDEQINAAIAEACGWKSKEETNGVPWLWRRTNINGRIESSMEPLSYCTDLNAMHEAEKVLTKEQVREYQTYMYNIPCEIKNTCGKWMPYSAPARYRAEAFLRTLELWLDK